MLQRIQLKPIYLLLVATLLVFLLSYQLAFKPTIAAWQLNRGLRTQLAGASNVSIPPGYQERKNKNLDRIIRSCQADSVDFRGRILSEIAELAQKEEVKLSEVPTIDPLYHSDTYIIQRLNFEGDYHPLLKTLKALQTAPGIGTIRSATFKLISDLPGKEKSKKIRLECYFEILNK